MKANPVLIEAVPEYTGLDGENADRYYRAGNRLAFLNTEVIEPYCSSLRATVPYDSENIPDKEEVIPVNFGEYGFLLRATPKNKRPGYKSVFEEIEGFILNRLDQYKEMERPVGIKTIDSEPYICSGDVLSRLSDARKKVISRDVSISIAKQPDIPDVSSMVVPLGMDMTELNQGNTSRYLEASGLSRLYSRFISGFEGDILGLTGFDNDNPPAETEHMYRRYGNHIFHLRTVPYESTDWGKVLSGLDKKPPKRNPEKGGDLVLVEYGLVAPWLQAYVPRKRDGKTFVRLEWLLSRMKHLKEFHTKTKVRQKPINHYPIV